MFSASSEIGPEVSLQHPRGGDVSPLPPLRSSDVFWRTAWRVSGDPAGSPLRVRSDPLRGVAVSRWGDASGRARCSGGGESRAGPAYEGRAGAEYLCVEGNCSETTRTRLPVGAPEVYPVAATRDLSRLTSHWREAYHGALDVPTDDWTGLTTALVELHTAERYAPGTACALASIRSAEIG